MAVYKIPQGGVAINTKILITLMVLLLVIFLSGCVKPEESKQPAFDEFHKGPGEPKQSPFDGSQKGVGELQNHCGDGICDGPETCESCPQDCGLS